MTTKNNKIQPKAVQGTAVANGEAKETALTIISKNEPTAEELQKENEHLRKLLASTPQSLAEKIKFYQQKEQAIKQLEVIKAKRDYFLSVQDDLNSEIEENDFMTENYSLCVTHKKGYSGEETIFKVNNPVFVADVVGFVLGKMANKQEELEILIEA